MAAPTGLLSTLARRDFALVWTGGLISYVGNWAMFTALAFHVYDQTHSAFASAAVPALMVAPTLLATLVGIWVDRWDRRRTLVAANLAMATATLPLLAAEPDTLWIVYASTLTVASVGVVVRPAENALLPRMVGPDRLMTANALNALNDNLGRIIGPLLGGAWFAIGGFGTVVAVNTDTYAIAAILIALVHSDPRTAAQDQPPLRHPENASPLRQAWHDWRSGLRMIQTTPEVTILFGVAATASLADAILSGLLAPFTIEVLAGDQTTLGLFLTIRGLGGLIGGYLLGYAATRLTPLRIIGASTLLIGLTIFIIVALPRIPVVLAAAAPLGIFVVAWLASQQTHLHKTIADTHLGRTFGTLGTLTATTVLIGTTLGGAIADLTGIRPLLLTAAALYAAAGTLTLVSIRHRPPTSRSTVERPEIDPPPRTGANRWPGDETS